MPSKKQTRLGGKDADLELRALCRAYASADTWGRELILNTAIRQAAQHPAAVRALAIRVGTPGAALD